jgi:hypothetical protein
MKSIAAAFGLAALVAIASGAPISPQAQETLTPIDTVPTRQQLDDAFSTPQLALQNLAALATVTDPNDPDNIGLRLRAIHALAKYCTSTPCAASDVAHTSLETVIADNRDQTNGPWPTSSPCSTTRAGTSARRPPAPFSNSAPTPVRPRSPCGFATPRRAPSR